VSKTRVETRARARALQALYAWDLRGEKNLERVSQQVFDDMAVEPDERVIASRILREIISGGPAIDEQLAEVTMNWRLARLGAVERSVLRLGAAELRQGVTPPRVVLQEAVKLAELYGTERSARFVNGVLDALARKLGRV
jgi:transcription antitermination protein NusB